MKKIIRTSTISMSLDLLLKGQLSFLNKYYEVVAVSGQDHHLEIVSKREGVRTESIEMQRSISPIKDFISLIKLYFFFRKEKPLMVHSITPKAGLLSMIAAYFAGVPIRIHTFTGLVFPYRKGFLHHLLLFMDKILCKFSTNIIPEGRGVKNDLEHFNVTNKPLNIIGNGNVNGIDVDYFNSSVISKDVKQELRNKLNILPTDFVYVFVGRLVTDKGINELVSAFSSLSKEDRNCKLLLVGPFEHELDPLQKETLNEIEENSAIITVGFQNDIRPYLSIAHTFVFPSHREGFPNVILQAGAMDLPCIVTDISGCNEIIIPFFNGLILPLKNIKAIFDALLLVKADIDLGIKMRSNARSIIVEKYQQTIVWNALLKEYDRLIEEYVQKNN